jgi:hypothetical protein
VTHQIYASVNLVEPTVAKAHLDLLGSDAGVEQLPPGDHSMLLRRQSRDEHVDSASEGFGVHMNPNPALGTGAPF